MAAGDRRWTLAAAPTQQDIDALVRGFGLHPVAATVLAQRQMRWGMDAATLEAFLDPKLERLPDPASLPGVSGAVACLLAALEANQRIAVFGDYDVDGISGTALLVRLLRSVDADVVGTVPNRSDGYGLLPQSVRALARQGVEVVVTVDNGIAALEAARTAADGGMKLIVTDHHTFAPEGLPQAAAHVHPDLDGGGGPWAGASGAGVALGLAIALRRAMRERGWFAQRPEPDLQAALQLATLGTIADIVPLVGVNRVIVANGLARLPRSEIVGVAALSSAAGAPADAWDADVVAFQLGPRLNAAGRIGDARRALNLLLTDDPATAARLAEALDRDNRVRRNQESQVLDADAFQRPDDLATRPLVFAAHPDWNHGVLGIVAGRLARRHHRPALLFAIAGDLAKGSARSIPEVDLMAALEGVRELAVAIGGHREAAGLTLPTAQLAEARRRIEAALRAEGGPEAWMPTLHVDAVVPVTQVDAELVRGLQRLAPFGAGNPRPTFQSDAFAPVRPRLIKGEHVGFDVPTGHGLVSAIAFRQPELYPLIKRRVETAFRPAWDTYRGGEAVQMLIEDLRPAML